MKIVDNRPNRGGIEIYPFLKPEDEIQFNGYITVWNDYGTIKVLSNISTTGQLTSQGAEMMANAWRAAFEIATELEKPNTAVVIIGGVKQP